MKFSLFDDSVIVPDSATTSANVALVMRIIGLADGTPTAYDGQWITEYDPGRAGRSPDGLIMLAHLAATSDRAQARRFNGLVEAHAFWCQTTPLGTRPDGQPDRPLTAFTVAIEPADE